MAKSTSSQQHPFYTDYGTKSILGQWAKGDPVKATWVNSYEGLREASGVEIGDRVRIKIDGGGWGSHGEDRIAIGHVEALYKTYFRVRLDRSHTCVCYAYDAFWDKDTSSKISFATLEGD